MTKKEQQDIVLEQLSEKLRDTVSIRERISKKFTNWFQELIEIPKPEAKDQKDAAGGGGDAAGGGGEAAAPPA
jgi:hypothetical protein